MSHHYSGPNIGFPRGDARLDLIDLYAFPKPGDPDKSILVMNVHPSVGLNPPGPTTAEPFAPGARYELKIRPEIFFGPRNDDVKKNGRTSSRSAAVNSTHRRQKMRRHLPPNYRLRLIVS